MGKDRVVRGISLSPVKLTTRQAQLYQKMRIDSLVPFSRIGHLLTMNERNAARFVEAAEVPLFDLVGVRNGFRCFSTDVVMAVEKCLLDVNMDRDTSKRIWATIRAQAAHHDSARRNGETPEWGLVDPDDE